MKPDWTVMTVMGKVFQDAPPAQPETGALGGFLMQAKGFFESSTHVPLV